jgi:tetrapyrrole methylase family protein/MazG family protein
VDSAPGVTKLFCESLDRFVPVRVFPPDQGVDLLRHVPVGSKQEYAQFLVKAAILNYDQEIAPLFAPPACNDVLVDVIMHELYSLCVKANPALEVRAIELPGTGDQVRRFCDTLDRWVSVRRLNDSELSVLTKQCQGSTPEQVRVKVVKALFPGLDASAAEEAEGMLEQQELLGLAIRVNAALKQLPLSDSDDTADVLDQVPGMPRGTPLERLLWVMDRLRDPDKGCPWDREQNHESLKAYLVEETHEVLEAIDSGEPNKITEELGDLLMQVVFHARLGKEKGHFDFQQVADSILRKLVTRHPHVFGNATAKTPEDVLKNWEAIKKVEKKKESVLEGVPETLPSLLKAYRLQEKASVVGDPDLSRTAAAIRDRAVAFADRAAKGEASGEDFGDLLFSLVNSARLMKLNAEFCMDQANRTFVEKFRAVEAAAKKDGRALDKMPIEEVERLFLAQK